MSVTMHSHRPAQSRWRFAFLALALILAATNLVELATTLQPGYWDRVGMVGLEGAPHHGKWQVTRVSPQAHPNFSAIQPGDLVAWESPAPGFAPNVRNFARYLDRTSPITLSVEHAGQVRTVSGSAVVAAPDAKRSYLAAQAGVDLVFALVGALMILRRSGDRAVCALGIAMICWSSNFPTASPSPIFDILFWVNQLTARIWYEVLLVYWAIHLAASGKWGLSKALVRAWPVWAAASIALGLVSNYSVYFEGIADDVLLKTIVDYNHYLMYFFTVAALAEGVYSSSGEARTRIKWGLFIFAGSFIIFPLRALVFPALRPDAPDTVALIDYSLQLVLPLGLMYATLRHRLLDLGFVINRGLVYGVISTFILLSFFGLEKLAEHFIHYRSHAQSAIVDGAIALGVFLFFHKVRHHVEHVVEHMFFSNWRRKESALRLFVAKAVHITHIQPLLSGFVQAVDQFCGHKGCAVYRVGESGTFQLAQGAQVSADKTIDANDPLVVAMRFAGGTISGKEVPGARSGVIVFPMIYRGRVDGFLALEAGAEREALRPDEIALLSDAAQQIGLDIAAIEADDNKRKAREWEKEAQILRGVLEMARQQPAAAASARR